MLTHVGAVDFGNHQRHLGFHPEDRRIVDHDRAGALRDGCILARDISARAEKRQVDAGKRFGRKLPRDDLFSTKRNARAGRAFGAQGQQLRDRKCAPLEDSQQFDPDGASRADNRNVIAFLRAGHGASYRRFG